MARRSIRRGIGLLVLTAALASAASVRADPGRAIQSFDKDWRFLKGDAAGAEAPAFSDAAWTRLNVPHDWAIEGPFVANAPSRGSGGFAPTGVVWYRKTFTLPPGSGGKRAFVDFDGVMQNSDVWINGFHLGKRPYGYISFQYELTGHLNAGGENVLAVRADTAQQPASRWYSGGGIYRHVRLEITDAVHIENWGTFVTTPKVAAAGATVHVRATVLNQSDMTRDVTLGVNVLGPDGRSVGTGETKAQSVPPGKALDFEQDISVASPKLWNLDDTKMYTAVASVKAGGVVIDDQAVPFGIREFEFKSDTGFWLNGKNFKLKGVCLHHDAGGLGAAVPEDEWIYRLKTLKQFGANAVRTAHNPPSPEFLDACDKVGMLVMDENFDCWRVGKNTYDYHLYFDEWSLIDTRDMVRRDRNHPSIILYSAGNEIHDTPRSANAIPILRDLVKTFHENDPTRPVTQALFRPNSDDNGGAYKNGMADLLDVVGTNYRDQELIDAWKAVPTRKIVGTENNRPNSAWAFVRDTPAYSGSFIWTGVDYLGETTAFPSIGGSFGILDITDRPKAEAYERASWWSETPVVYMARVAAAAPGGRGGAAGGAGGATRVPMVDWTPGNMATPTETVNVYSNCQEVELFLNDKSLGAKPRGAVDSVRTWAVDFAAGTLKAVGKNGGQVAATQELKTAGAAAKVTLTPASSGKLYADFDSLAIVTVSITDEKGVQVPTASNNVSFAINGPGEIAALASGGPPRNQNFRGTEHGAAEGQLMAYIRATGNNGPITLTASAEGLAKGTLTIETAPARPGR